MQQGFIVPWSSDRLRAAREAGCEGGRAPFLFGGPHTSHPSLLRYRIAAGDRVYPVSVSGGAMHLHARLVLGHVEPIDAFHERRRLPQRPRTPENLLEIPCDLKASLRAWSWLAWTCTSDAAEVLEASPLVLRRPLTIEQMRRVRLVNKQVERGLRLTDDGRLTAVSSLQGHYFRVSDDTAAMFDAIVIG